jgi:hypothetical protein
MLQAERLGVQFLMRSLDFSSSPNPSSCTMALGLTQPLTEISTRNLSGGVKGGQYLRLTTSLPSVSHLDNVRPLTSHNPVGLHSLLQG